MASDWMNFDMTPEEAAARAMAADRGSLTLAEHIDATIAHYERAIRTGSAALFDPKLTEEQKDHLAARIEILRSKSA